MEKFFIRRRRSRPGGIIGLARFVEEHHEAIERDLLTETGHELNDVGRTLSWGALASFLSTVKVGSALGNDLNPELAEWATQGKTNAILADIYDQLSLANMYLRMIATRKRGRKPEPYKRPGAKRNEKRIGKGALSVQDMRAWIRKKMEVRDHGDD
jgi:hypothetical protein